MADRLVLGDRRQLLVRLDELEREVASIASWLGQQDADEAAVMVQCAARDLGAAAWELERPLRVRSAG